MPPANRNSRSKKQSVIKPKKKGKFNYRTATYTKDRIRDRKIKNEEIENRRKRIEEMKAKQHVEDSSDDEEENPLHELLKTFPIKDNTRKVAITTDSENSDEEQFQENDEVGTEVEREDDNDNDIVSAEGECEEDLENTSEDDLENMSEDGLENMSEDDFENTSEDDSENMSEDDLKSVNESEENKLNKEIKHSDSEKDTEFSEEHNEIEIKDNDEEDEETAREDAGHIKDPFTIHLRNDLDNELYQSLTHLPLCLKTEQIKWPNLGNIICQIPQKETKVEEEPMAKKLKVSILEKDSFAECGKVPQLISKIDWNSLYVKSQIQDNILKANYENIKDGLDNNPMTSFQKELFSIINNYQDLFYPERTFNNESEVRFVYCLHVVNHILKTRTKILHHNAKIKKSKLKDISEIPDEYRDQGLARPKVLIIVPFRHSCLKIVELLISIFIGVDRGGSVINKTRFMEDFGGKEIIMPIKNPKPKDYEQLFNGNIDDSFKIGISITKKALKLYSDFYSSDIIISSVLGLRMTIGAEGEEHRNYDFLASIELLIMDQIEVFFMQNWDHLLHILDHLHLQPKSSHSIDFSRVRSWCVNGWSKYYRQTLIFSTIQIPEIYGVFNKCCFNYAGKVKVVNPVSTGSIAQVVVQLPQVFHKFQANDHIRAIDARFEFFTSKILPQYKDSIMNHTLIFVPSYFDYVRLRNYFRKEELSFVQICEYTKDDKIAKARDMFFHSDANTLLYTERFHFFRRIRIKGIRHIIFYGPPAFPHFYSEMCNLMQESYQNPKSGSGSNMTVTTIYCKYDILMLAAIVGIERASKMVTSDKPMHMVMTDG